MLMQDFAKLFAFGPVRGCGGHQLQAGGNVRRSGVENTKAVFRALQKTARRELPDFQTRSFAARTPSSAAQWAQQYIMPPDSTPWPMIFTPQCSHSGAIKWIAHSKQSK
jgi:hypothetical protein